MKHNKTVMGIADSEGSAQDALFALRDAGFLPPDISVLLSDRNGRRDLAHEQHTKAPEGATAGVAGGGLVGGAVGLLAGIGALAIPGLGPFLAAGPLMAALSGAAAGAAVGGVTGALIGLGIPEIEAKRYEGKLKDGNVLIAVHVEDAEAEKRARDAFEQSGVEDVSTTREKAVPDRSVEGAKQARAARGRIDSQI